MRTAIALAVFILLAAWTLTNAKAHDWYPYNCCSGFDCRAIEMDDVELSPAGFLFKEGGQIVPYNDPRVRKTPPEGGNRYHICTVGGKPDGEVICLYIPNWGS